MIKSEFRNPKFETNPKFEIRMTKTPVLNLIFRASNLSFDKLRMVSEVEPFRASCFGFRILSMGFTLVEVLTTLVILSMGTLAIHQAFGRSIQAVKHSEEALLVSHLVPAPLVLAQLESWYSGKTPRLQEQEKAFENYPGFSYGIDAREQPLNDLGFVRYEVEIKSRSGAGVKRVWLLPEEIESHK